MFADPYHPIYPAGLILVVAVAAWLMGVAIPIYRVELAVEGETRLRPLDGLRGLLCLAVFCHHAAVTFDYVDTGPWLMPPSRLSVLFGRTSVGLFFAITAFLFWSKVERSPGPSPIWPFFRSRLFRLVPLYLVCCLASLAVVARAVDWSSGSTARGLLNMGLMGLRPWGPLGDVPINDVSASVTWSLQYEWGFYVLLPALELIARGRDPRRLWFLLAGEVILVGPGPALLFTPGFLAVYAARRPGLVDRLRRGWASVGVVVSAALVPWLGGDGFGFRGLVLSTLIFVPIACGNTVFGLLTCRGTRLLGLVSYSVYLLHGIVLYLAHPILARAKHAASGPCPRYWAVATGLALVTLVVSLATYRLVEWPCIRFEKRLRAAQPATSHEPAADFA